MRVVRRTGEASFLAAMIMIVSSCLGLTLETRFNDDGSGTMVMRLTVSKAVFEMTDGEEGFEVPLSKEEIEQELEGAEGVRLVEVLEEETDTDIIVTSVVEFDDLDSLVSADDTGLKSASLSVKDGTTTFSMLMGEGRDEMLGDEAAEAMGGEIDEATMAMIGAFLEGYFLEYRISAPSRIVRHTHGELSADGTSVTLSVPMADYFQLAEEYRFEVEW